MVTIMAITKGDKMNKIYRCTCGSDSTRHYIRTVKVDHGITHVLSFDGCPVCGAAYHLPKIKVRKTKHQKPTHDVYYVPTWKREKHEGV